MKLALIVLVSWFCVTTQSRNLPQYEINALHDLYDSTNGPNWEWDWNEPESTEWNFDSSNVNPCRDQWQGISCQNSTVNASLANVYAITLDYYFLRGTLPPSIGNFSELRGIDLSNNRLRGRIPEQMGNLEALRYITFNNNTFSNSIPEALFNLMLLTDLHVSENHLNGSISSSVEMLISLETLTLNLNHLTGTIPDSLGYCSKLESFDFSDNFLHGSPPTILGSIDALQELYLSDNYFNGSLSEQFADFCNEDFVSFVIDTNMFTGSLPASLNNCTNLVDFYVEDNQFNGTIPDYTWEFIQYFYVNFNNLTGSIPMTLSNQINQLDMAFNALNGSIPFHLLNGSIDIIDLGHNQLSGSLSFTSNDLLTSFDVNSNRMTGTIPELLFASMAEMADLSSNYFHGTLPTQYSPTMETLDVGSNLLEGTLPDALTQLEQLVSLDVSANLFHGPIPAFSASTLEAIKADTNQLTGTIPASLFASSRMLFLNIGDNYVTGTIPVQSMSMMTSLTSLSLNANYLSGALPSDLSKLPSIQSIFLDSNMLTGDLGSMFDSSIQAVLKYVDVSDNQIAGTIPTSPFLIRSLLSFAAVSNCLYGSLPSAEICVLNNLTTLALDGMESASDCQQVFFPNAPYIYKAYGIQNKVPGPIAACLFNMTSLSTLHLSGNAITGSIAKNVIVSDVLQDLSLSHNSLTGTIPHSIQLRPWTNLDLSYNKLTGGLSHDFPEVADDSSLSLEVNRLSGVIPHSLKHALDIDILDGNLWKCDTDRSQLPDHDKNNEEYECGSNTFNYSIYIWIVMSFVATVFFAVIWFKTRDENAKGWSQQLCSEFRSWMSVFSSQETNQLTDVNLSSLGDFARGVRKSNGWITLFIAMVLMPVYLALSLTENTYAYEYAWTVSAAYLSGSVSTGLLLAGFAILGALSVFVLHKYVGINGSHSASEETVERTYSTGLVLSYIAVIIVNVGLVTVVNVGYVYVHVNYSSAIVHLAQFALAVFKLVWNNWAVRELLKMTKRFERGGNTRVGVEVFMILFNNLGAPFIATAFVSTNCFYNVVAAPPTVHVSYSYKSCLASSYYSVTFENTTTPLSVCLFYNPTEVVSTSYKPPFVYSYQCTSTFITTYATIYVFMFILAAFVSPVAFAVLLVMYKKSVPNTSVHMLLDLVTPRILKPATVKAVQGGTKSRGEANPRLEKLMSGYEESEYETVFHCDLFVVKVINIFAMIVTFGAVLPPLAVVGLVAVVSFTYYSQLLIGRYVVRAQSSEDRSRVIESMNRDCEHASDMFMNAVWIVAPFAMLFYAMLLLDTLGDGEGWRRSLWAPVVTLVVPVGVWLMFRLYQKFGTSTAGSHSKKDSFFADQQRENSLTVNPVGVNVGIVGKL